MSLGVFVSEDGKQTIEAIGVTVIRSFGSWRLVAWESQVAGIQLAEFSSEADADRQHEDIRRWHKDQEFCKLMLAEYTSRNDFHEWRKEYLDNLIYDLHERKVKPSVAQDEARTADGVGAGSAEAEAV